MLSGASDTGSTNSQLPHKFGQFTGSKHDFNLACPLARFRPYVQNPATSNFTQSREDAKVTV